MQRNENETFDAYKVRRAASNLAVKNINAESRGGSESSRSKQRQAARDAQKKTPRGIKGMASSHRSPMGRDIAASFAAKRLTMARQHSHAMHLAHIATRTAERAAAKADA